MEQPCRFFHKSLEISSNQIILPSPSLSLIFSPSLSAHTRISPPPLSLSLSVYSFSSISQFKNPQRWVLLRVRSSQKCIAKNAFCAKKRFCSTKLAFSPQNWQSLCFELRQLLFSLLQVKYFHFHLMSFFAHFICKQIKCHWKCELTMRKLTLRLPIEFILKIASNGDI
jgi:hypothetical protein